VPYDKRRLKAMPNQINELSVLAPEKTVRESYSVGGQATEAALCCPVSKDPRYLNAIPAEVQEGDYGFGDPTPYVRPGSGDGLLLVRIFHLERLSACPCWVHVYLVSR
jgi:hypothetical protein